MVPCTMKFFFCCPQNAKNVKRNMYKKNIQDKAIELLVQSGTQHVLGYQSIIIVEP